MQQWITFDYFFLRKAMLLKYSYAFIVMPGGFGTLDEMFNTLTLIQTRSLTQFPVVLFGGILPAADGNDSENDIGRNDP